MNSNIQNHYEGMQIGKTVVNSCAQLFTLIAYSEQPHLRSANIPFHTLHYQITCEDFGDFCACLRIIGGYHDFDAQVVIQKGTPFFKTKMWYPVGNGNHGRDMFRFIIAREYSATFYIEYSTYLQDKQVIEGEQNRGKWQRFTGDDFEDIMLCLNHVLKPSEFRIEKQLFEAANEEHYSYSVRFCWT